MIMNQGFEDGPQGSPIPSWTHVGSTSQSTGTFVGQAPFEGSYQAVITNGNGTVSTTNVENFFNLEFDSLRDGLGYVDDEPNGASGIRQEVDLEAGESIRFRYALVYDGVMGAQPSAPGREVAFFVLNEVGGSKGNSLDVNQLGPVYTRPTNDPWNPTDIPYTTVTTAAVSSTGTYQLGFGNSLFNNSATAPDQNQLILYIDSVSVVPEPSAALAFSAFLALAMGQRHRRRSLN